MYYLPNAVNGDEYDNFDKKTFRMVGSVIAVIIPSWCIFGKKMHKNYDQLKGLNNERKANNLEITAECIATMRYQHCSGGNRWGGGANLLW